MGESAQHGAGAAAYQSGDWRGPVASAGGPSGQSPRRAAVHRDPFHLRARAAGLADERDRARDIVVAARAAVTATFAEIRAGRRADIAALEPVVAGIAASISRHPVALPSVTRLKQVHEYTYLHSVSVCGLMLALAGELGLPDAAKHEIGLAGLLHDIGKAAIPTALLDKPGPLDLEEYALVQQHTVRGRELLGKSGIDAAIVLDVALQHHERVDGGGYPLGLRAAELGVHARMGAVCDVYDAVTSRRAYKESWSPGAALDWMASAEGQFDPRALRAFRRLVGPFPVGALVLLTSGRLAVVLDGGPEGGDSPDICPFFCAETRRPLPPTRISSTRDPILAIETAQRWALDDWDTRRTTLLATFAPN